MLYPVELRGQVTSIPSNLLAFSFARAFAETCFPLVVLRGTAILMLDGGCLPAWAKTAAPLVGDE